MMKDHPHPGSLLREDVFVPLGMGVTAAASHLAMSRVALSRVLNVRAALSPALALRLEQAGVSTARFWMNLQMNYDLYAAMQQKQPKIKRLLTEEAA